MDKNAIRYNAADAVVKLALRKQDAATSRPGKNAVRGKDDTQVLYNPDLMQEVIEYFRIANEIHPSPTLLNWLGLAEERVGDFDAAILSYETMAKMVVDDLPPPLAHANKTYRELAAMSLDRLRKKKAGNYDAAAAMEANVAKMIDQISQSPHMGADEKESLKAMYESLPDIRLAPGTFDASIVPAPADADAAADVAARFGECIADGEFEVAHSLLSSALQKELSPAKLAGKVKEMLGGEAAERTGVLNTMHDWPAMLNNDVLWAYVTIESPSWNEAATVIIAREQNRLLIRDIEWGRP